MEFAIQVGNPTIWHPQIGELEELSEAIADLFARQTEDAILYWNRIPVRIGYKYDLSFLIDDLLPLLDAVLRTKKGSYQVMWSEPSFYAYWDLVWDELGLTIEAQWDDVAGSYEALLNSRQTVQISRESFLREWKGLLRKVIDGIEVTGLQIEEEEQLEMLYDIEAAIPCFGQLYEAQGMVISPPQKDAPLTLPKLTCSLPVVFHSPILPFQRAKEKVVLKAAA